MESFSRMFIERLFKAFFDWLNVNAKAIGDKRYQDLWRKGKDAEADCNTLFKMMGDAMWMFNMVTDCGVLAGVRRNSFDLQHLENGIDEQSSKRLLALVSSSLGLQGLPKEILEQEIPIITSKHFSLKLWNERRGIQ